MQFIGLSKFFIKISIGKYEMHLFFCDFQKFLMRIFYRRGDYMPEEKRDEAAEYSQQVQKSLSSANDIDGKFLTFLVKDEVFAIEIKYVNEILGMQSITKMPKFPDFVKGIVNVRGKIIPIIDVSIRFELQPQPYDERTCIIVVQIGSFTVGMVVDKILEVVYINESDIVPPPSTRLVADHHRYIKGIGKTEDGVKSILDCEKLLFPDEFIGDSEDFIS